MSRANKNLKIYESYIQRSRKWCFESIGCDFWGYQAISVSKEFKELVIKISLELIFVDRGCLFGGVTISLVDNNLNFSKLFISFTINVLTFFFVLPFIIGGIKLMILLFFGELAFSFGIDNRFQFWVHESFILYAG